MKKIIIGLICLLVLVLIGCMNAEKYVEDDSEFIPISEIKVEEEPYVTCSSAPLEDKDLCCTSKGFDGWNFNISVCDFNTISDFIIENTQTSGFMISKASLIKNEDVFKVINSNNTTLFNINYNGSAYHRGKEVFVDKEIAQVFMEAYEILSQIT